MAFDRIPGYNPSNTVGSRLPTAEQDEIRAVSDYLGKPRVLQWTGSAWPPRPDDSVTTIFVGGTAPDDAPTSLVAGDIWMPASEPGGGVVTGLISDGSPTLGGNLDLNGHSIDGSAGAIQMKRMTAAEWASSTYVLAEGEEGYETDTGRSKIGNGEDQWGDLEYVGGLGVPTDYLTDNSGDYMVNDVVRYTDPAPSPTADLTGLYACITDHTSGSPKDYPARWRLVIGYASPEFPYSADYWCDVTAASYQSRSAGIVSAATLLTHNTPAGRGYVETGPSVTNRVATWSGYTTGVIGSGGVMPTGWQEANVGVAKTLISCSEVVLEWQMTLGAGDAAGIRSPQYTGVGTGDWELSFYFAMSGARVDNLRIYACWDSDGSGITYVSPAPSLGEGAPVLGGGRVTLTLPPANTANDKLLIMVQNPSGVDITADVLIENIVLAPAVSDKLWDGNPLITGTQTARSATVNVPNGSYVVAAWTERGIRLANATASGGAGINLLAALGPAKITKLAVWQASRYVTGMITDDPRYVPVYANDVAGLLRLQDKTAGLAQMFLHGPGNDYNTQRSLAYWSRDRTEARPGDTTVNPFGHPDLYKRRAEVVSMYSQPFDTDVWMSLPFKIDGSLTIPGAWGVIWQWRFTDMVGDTVTLSPEFALSIGLNNGLFVDTRSATVQNPPANPAAVNRWTGAYVPGQWHRFVARMRFSQSGGGKLGIWFDGQQVYAWQDTPLGYNKTFGPQAHWGFYGAQSEDVIVIERANVEFGTTDLSDRILNPLPI